MLLLLTAYRQGCGAFMGTRSRTMRADLPAFCFCAAASAVAVSLAIDAGAGAISSGGIVGRAIDGI